MSEPSPTATVLLVDDQPIIVESVRAMLAGEAGIAFHAVTDPRRALETALEISPTVILQDLVMPGVNGLDLVRRYRAHEATKHVPVVVLSVKEEPEIKAEAFRLGANDYLVKLPSAVELSARMRYHSDAYVNATQSRLAFEALRESREQLRARNEEIRRQRDAVARQASELEDKNEQLRAEIFQREALISELDAFARTVAHDLKNPISPIRHYGERLRDEWESLTAERRHAAADRIVRASDQMERIIDALLMLSRVRGTEVEIVSIDMADVIATVCDRQALALERSNAKLRAPASWPASRGYAPWVEEVWANYLSNAIKYGGSPPEIELGAEIERGHCRFWVRDNGKGLTAEQRARLFIPFTRLRKDVEGHGLGLSIVQRIVERLGGKVAVASAGGERAGSEFSFTLPTS